MSTIGIVARKCGMTRVIGEDGSMVPVSVVQIDSNKITQIKNNETDGYSALQVAFGLQKASRINKAEAGVLAKAKVAPAKGFKEFRLKKGESLEGFELGAQLSVDQFEQGQMVDARGVSKGKGFAGVIKRHNFSMQDATHGNSLSHRAHGSTGQCQFPGRVFKGKKMAGQMGNKNVCVTNLKVVRVDAERNLLLISGAVPGATGSYVIITASDKRKGGI